MPRTSAQLEIARQQSRDRLINAAIEVFSRHGYEGASIKQLAAAAGVAQGLLYHYFPSKAELLRAIFARGLADIQASFEAAAVGANPVERLDRLIRLAFAGVRQNLDFWRLSYSLRHQPEVMVELGPGMATAAAQIRGHLEQLCQAIGYDQPAIAAAALFAQIDGACQHYALEPDHYPIEAVIDWIVSRACRPPNDPPLPAQPTIPGATDDASRLA